MNNTLKKVLKISLRVLLTLALIIILLYGLLQIPAVQTWVVGKVAKNLSAKLHTKVSVDKVKFRFFNQLILEGLLIEDQKKDTLLYAQAAKTNVNDWFIFKDKISLKNIQLNDAIINMNRTDSVWNYQFLVDFFATPNDPNKKKKQNLEIDLRQIHFTNIHFTKADYWIGQSLVASLKKFDLLMDSLNFNTKRVAIKEVYLSEPQFWQSNFTGKRPPQPDIREVLEKIPVISAFKWNNSGWVVTTKKITVDNGSFRSDKETERPVFDDKFDGQHIYFSGISGTIENLQFLNDTLAASIHLSAKERCGLEVKKLKSDMRFTPDEMVFNHLDLQTNNSTLGDYYAMRYNRFNDDMSSFINKVTLEINFNHSKIYSDDIALFAPALKTWNRIFELEGHAKGTIDNFVARDMKIKSGPTYLDGTLSMHGLPDINSTFIDLDANELTTHYTDLAILVPALKHSTVPDFNSLGNIHYKGRFTGFPLDFVTYGTFKTNLGIVQSDMNMKLQAGKDPVYSGKIQTNGFHLGRFLRDPHVGMLAVDTKIKGNGFTLKTLDASIDGSISRIDYNSYSYRNITMNGKFTKRKFEGYFAINDPNIRVRELYGTIDLSQKEAVIQANADVTNINFKNLGLLKENISFSGLLNLNFTGNNIDNFLGNARISRATLLIDSNQMRFDSLSLTSFIQDGQKKLQVRSNEIEASIAGNFKIMELPNAFQRFLYNYYPSYFKEPKTRLSNQDFSFHVQTYQFDSYTPLLSKKLTGFNNTLIEGSLKSETNELSIRAQVPQFGYDGRLFSNTLLNGKGTLDTLFADVLIDQFKLNDSLYFPNSKITLAAHHDVSTVQILTRASKTLNSAELNSTVYTLTDGVRLHFSPSSFVINNKKWILEKDGELTLRKKYLDANEVKFIHDDQEIALSTEMDELTDETHLVAHLRNINIDDFAPFVIVRPALKGILNGKGIISDITGKPIIKFNGVADSLSMDGEYIGHTNIDAIVNTDNGLINFVTDVNDEANKFKLQGYFNYKDTTGKKVDMAFDAEKFNLAILEPYMNSIFSELSGTANGNIRIYSNNGNQYITGLSKIKDGRLKVAYTQVTYLLNNQTINFGDNVIDLGLTTLKDTLGNEGTLSGKLHHRFFKNFEFENIRVESQHMLLLNTSKKDNSQFYGKVIGSALMTIDGPLSDIRMNISGQPGIFDSSHIYLPTGESKESNAVDYIDFVKFGTEMQSVKNSTQTANITVNMNIVANPSCKIDVILDEETGDVIKGEGNGRLNIRVGTREPLSIRGQYEISKGEYTFNFQTFFKKPFTLKSGTITWNGDPYLAIIDMDAEYLAKNVDMSNLSPGSGLRLKDDIIILSHLSGSLKKPLVTFEFDLPERSPLRKDYIVIKRLADFKNDENTMNKQVASLLLFNTFISDEQNFFSQQNTIGLATNTIGSMLSGWLTNTFNKELEKATNGVVSSYIDINPIYDPRNPNNQLQANVRGGLKLMPGKKFIVYLGGNLDYNNPYFLNRRGLFTPDISMEWLLRTDGSLRLVGFNRTSTDFTTGQRNRWGVQLSYRKDAEKISDLFKGKKKLQELKDKRMIQDSTPTP